MIAGASAVESGSAALAKPDLLLLVLLAGILLVYAECNLPGRVIPGCLGLLLILLAVFHLYALSVSPAAVFTLAAGVVLLLLELLRPARFLFAALSFSALSAGLFHLVAAPGPHLLTAVAVALVFCSVTLLLGRIALRARRNKTQRVAPNLTFADSLPSTPHSRAE